MRRRNYQARLVVLMSILLLGGVVAMPLSSQGGKAQAFSEAELFFELNDTDGDLGIHASIDGGTWTHITITAPNGRALLNVSSQDNLQTQASPS
jgi:hypothetical protein